MLTRICPYVSLFLLCGNSSVVERDLAKVDVAGPTPVSRSKPPFQEVFLFFHRSF